MKSLQGILLWSRSYPTQNLSQIDGYYGPNTRDAIKDWQDDHGLSADGCVGYNTWTKMWGETWFLYRIYGASIDDHYKFNDNYGIDPVLNFKYRYDACGSGNHRNQFDLDGAGNPYATQGWAGC